MPTPTLRHRRRPLFLIFLIGLSALVQVLPTSPVRAADSLFAGLQRRLVADGFDPGLIAGIYARPEVDFESRGVSLFFRHSEAKLNYGQFTKPRPLDRAREYLATHRAALAATEKRFGVDKEVIIAIMLVETGLGRTLGRRSILNTLSSMAALDDTDVREQVWEQVRSSKGLTRQRFDSKSEQKADWAYRELKAFLKYIQREGIDPVGINGSYAGALGIAQFMPSSILAHAVDGNTDGRIDLFDHADAIASIANYLQHYGWHPGIEDPAARKVIFRYNRSTYYVNTILEIAARLKG